MIHHAVLVVAAVALGLFRVLGYKSASYQALAHLFVGALLGAWLVGRDPWHLAVLVGLTILETACFLASRGAKLKNSGEMGVGSGERIQDELN